VGSEEEMEGLPKGPSPNIAVVIFAAAFSQLCAFSDLTPTGLGIGLV